MHGISRITAVFLSIPPLAGAAPAGPAGGDAAEPAPREAPSDVPASRELLLRAPFSVARPSFFYACLEVPPLEPARTLPEGSVVLRARSTNARSVRSELRTDGRTDRFDGLYHEFGCVSATWAPVDAWELSGRAVLAGWNEQKDIFQLFTSGGDPLVRFEEGVILNTGASKRHENLSVVGLEGKRLLMAAEDAGLDLSLAASFKFPFGRERDLTHAGTTDAALTVRGDVPFAWGTLHAQLWGTVPMGSQDLFVPEADVRLDPFVHAAVGATWRATDALAFGVQFEGNSSAFHDVPFLDGTPVTAVAGVRWAFDRVVLEAAGGAGFDPDSSYQFLYFASIAYAF